MGTRNGPHPCVVKSTSKDFILTLCDQVFGVEVLSSSGWHYLLIAICSIAARCRWHGPLLVNHKVSVVPVLEVAPGTNSTLPHVDWGTIASNSIIIVNILNYKMLLVGWGTLSCQK